MLTSNTTLKNDVNKQQTAPSSIATSDIAIYAEHLVKEYQLGSISGTTLKADLQSRMARWRGKEDPNTLVGSTSTNREGYIRAINDVSFTIKKGERIGLIGKNGAGKSTLLKLICRITAPTEGFIGYNGKITSMLEIGTGFHPELTGRENIYLNGAILGMTKKEVDKHLDDIIEFSEVEEHIDTPVKRYSSGMYVRLAFAVSAHLNADIVVMDEVLAVGDIAFQQKCLTRMREIADADNRTILYVSHHLDTVHELCNRCFVIDEGKIIFDGNVSQSEHLYRSYLRATSSQNYEEASAHLGPIDKGAMIVGATYPTGHVVTDKLNLHLTWECQHALDNINLRVELRNRGRTFASKNFLNIPKGKAGERLDYDFEIDVSQIQNGEYSTRYCLFEMDEHGSVNQLDQVEGLDFSINDPARDELFVWQKDMWGNIRL